YSPDGQRLACCLAGLAPIVMDAATGNELVKLKMNDGGAQRAVFSSDGKQLITAGLGRTNQFRLTLWNAQNGQELQSETVPQGKAFGVTFSPDGSRVAAWNTQGSVHVW